ncbi:hypothetical protein ACTXT7_014553 [Hymenolepis weldensis]
MLEFCNVSVFRTPVLTVLQPDLNIQSRHQSLRGGLIDAELYTVNFLIQQDLAYSIYLIPMGFFKSSIIFNAHVNRPIFLIA